MANNVASPMTALSAAIDRLSANSVEWNARRTVDEGLDIVRDYCWAGASALYSCKDGRIAVVGHRPNLDSAAAVVVPDDWFPWGLAPMNPQRFIFVEQAGQLPATPESPIKLADLGIESCLHLPILERERPLGFLQVFWTETRLVWDDEMGRILRTLGRYLLDASTRTR